MDNPHALIREPANSISEPLTVQAADPANGATPASAAAQWGLASMLLSCLVLLLVPLVGIVWTLIPMSIATVSFWDRSAITAASILMMLAVFGLTVLSVFTLIYGLAGWHWAATRKLPRALHVAASVVGIVGLLGWLPVLVITFVTAMSLHNIR
jgi:hypothetical protein